MVSDICHMILGTFAKKNEGISSSVIALASVFKKQVLLSSRHQLRACHIQPVKGGFGHS